jgi:hypothetical protein
MSNQHLITPPPELIEEWWNEFVRIESDPDADSLPFIASKAAKWGADQELEACCDWLCDVDRWKIVVDRLRAARRPKPPSLKEQALDWCNDYIDPDGIIRRALEALPDD